MIYVILVQFMNDKVQIANNVKVRCTEYMIALVTYSFKSMYSVHRTALYVICILCFIIHKAALTSNMKLK